MHFPNRPWLRSFGSAWGLGKKTARMKRFLAIVTNIKKQENSKKPLLYVYAYSSETLWSFLNAKRKAYSKNSRMVLLYILPNFSALYTVTCEPKVEENK